MSVAIHTSRRERLIRLSRFEDAQFGAFTCSQAAASDIPSSTLSDWVTNGDAQRIHATVYVRGSGFLSLDTRRSAALLATGTTSCLKLFAALHVFGCSRFAQRSVQIGVARLPRTRLRGVDVSLCDAARYGHVIRRRGHRVTTMAWTITDLGAVLRPEQIAHVIQQARLRRQIDIAELRGLLAARGRFVGCVNVRRAIEMYLAGSSGTRSPDEDTVYGWVRELVRRPPLPNMFVQAGDQSFEVDIPFRSRRLCIEIDGPLHDDPEQMQRDRIRDEALRRAGYRVERFHWRDIRDHPERCRARLRALLA